MFAHGGNIKGVMEKYGLSIEKIIDFSANINPLAPPDYLKDVILEHIQLVAHYPDEKAENLQLAISEYIGVEKQKIIPANGSVELIYLLAQALSSKTALILAPAFSEYAKAFTGRYKFLRRKEEKNFQVCIDELLNSLSGIGVVFLGNPNNPNGDIVKREEVLEIAKIAGKQGILVVVDEVFMDFLGQEETVVSGVDVYKNLFILRSLTKFFGLPGLRVGYGVANPDLIKQLSSLQPPWSVNSLAQAVGAKVLGDKHFIRQSKEFMEKERVFLFEELAKIKGLKPYLPRANFILVKLLKHNSRWVCDKLGRQGLILRDCSNFDFLDTRFIRVAVRKRAENLCLLQALKEVAPLA